MPEGDAIVSITPGTGKNVRTIRVTQWIIDPITGVGAWTDVDLQVLVMADHRGDLISNEELMGEMLSELRIIRELFEHMMLKLG